jgi:hypothetical protein
LTWRRPDKAVVLGESMTMSRSRTSNEASWSWFGTDKSGFSRRLVRALTRLCALLADLERQSADVLIGADVACRISRYEATVSS